MRRTRRDPFFVATTVLCGMVVAWVFIISLLNEQPPRFDPVGHFLDGVYLLKTPHQSLLFQARPSYPFLVSFVAIPFNLFGSYRYDISSAGINSVFLVGTVVALYLIGRDLFSRRAGFLAGLLFALYPIIAGQALSYMLDLSVTFFGAATVLFLVRCKGFTDRRYAFVLGATVGLGTLTKFTFPLFVAGPLLVTAGLAVFREVRARWLGHFAPMTSTVNVIDAGLLALAIAAPWYLPRLSYLGGDFRTTAARGASAPRGGGNHPPDALFYYPLGLWKMTTLVLAVAFLVFGIVYFVRGGRGRLVLGAWLLGSYIGLTALVTGELRFFMPVLPAVALVTAAGIEEVVARLVGRLRAVIVLVVAALAGFGVFQVYAATVGIGSLGPGRLVTAYPRSGQSPWLFSQHWAYVPKLRTNASSPESFLAHVPFRKDSPISLTTLADREFTSVLELPLVRRSLVSRGHDYVSTLLPAWRDYPTDVVIVQEELHARAGAPEPQFQDFLSRAGANVRYRAIYRARVSRPSGDRDLVIYRRVQ